MERQKKMKDCFAEIEGMFPSIPEMVRIFQGYEREIRYYNRYDWCETTTKEKLIEKRDIFLDIVKKLDNVDLLILFYIKNTDGLGKLRMMKILRDMYNAQCKFKNALCGRNEHIDILEIGQTRIFEKDKKPKKNCKNNTK